jgi:hypothetical protein
MPPSNGVGNCGFTRAGGKGSRCCGGGVQLQLEVKREVSRQEALQLCRELLQKIIAKRRELQHLELTLKLHLRKYGFVLAEYPRSYVLEGEEFPK